MRNKDQDTFRGRSFGRREALLATVGAGLVASAVAEPGLLRCNGTGSGLAMLRSLGDEWMQAGPEAVPLAASQRPMGSGGGIGAVAAGHLDLAVASRDLTDAERASGLTAWPFARSPLVFATRRGLDPGSMTIGQIERMLVGEIPSWPDGTPVLLVRRPPGDATARTAAMFSPSMPAALEALRRRPGVPIAASDVDNADMLEARLGSLGTIVHGHLLAERRRLTPLAIEGYDPSPDAVRDGRYRPTVTLAIVLSATAAPAAQRFTEFVRTAPAAHSLLAAMGFVPWQG